MRELDPPAIRRRLLRWYDRERRALPWRAGKGSPANPYHVLVSEAMLQQTQVATVIPYFVRFVGELPTVTALAAAPEQRVLRLWQGLGYYRRARNLHAAAQRIVSDFAGEVPRCVEDLLTLPGVGRYTAGAIASIAYDVPAPILDGNVARVLARLRLVEEPVDAPAVRARLWDAAECLVPSRRAGDFNQALMELGALVCTPRAPRCLYCPLREHCAAYETGEAEQLPVMLPRRKPTDVQHHVVSIVRGGKHLLQQRPSTGLWADLWELPTFEGVAVAELPLAVREELGLNVGDLGEVGQFVHQTTHRTVSFQVWSAPARSGRVRPGRRAWRRLTDIDDLPLARPQLRAVEMVRRLRASAG